MEWLIYPNPANDYFSINFTSATSEELEIRIINVLGQILVKKKIEVVTSSKKTETISIFNFEKGIYFIEVESQNGFKSSRKIIKE